MTTETTKDSLVWQDTNVKDKLEANSDRVNIKAEYLKSGRWIVTAQFVVDDRDSVTGISEALAVRVVDTKKGERMTYTLRSIEVHPNSSGFAHDYKPYIYIEVVGGECESISIEKLNGMVFNSEGDLAKVAKAKQEYYTLLDNSMRM